MNRTETQTIRMSYGAAKERLLRRLQLAALTASAPAAMPGGENGWESLLALSEQDEFLSPVWEGAVASLCGNLKGWTVAEKYVVEAREIVVVYVGEQLPQLCRLLLDAYIDEALGWRAADSAECLERVREAFYATTA